jgi:hypothetical protein
MELVLVFPLQFEFLRLIHLHVAHAVAQHLFLLFVVHRLISSTISLYRWKDRFMLVRTDAVQFWRLLAPYSVIWDQKRSLLLHKKHWLVGDEVLREFEEISALGSDWVVDVCLLLAVYLSHSAVVLSECVLLLTVRRFTHVKSFENIVAVSKVRNFALGDDKVVRTDIGQLRFALTLVIGLGLG